MERLVLPLQFQSSTRGNFNLWVLVVVLSARVCFQLFGARANSKNYTPIHRVEMSTSSPKMPRAVRQPRPVPTRLPLKGRRHTLANVLRSVSLFPLFSSVSRHLSAVALSCPLGAHSSTLSYACTRGCLHLFTLFCPT